MTTKMLVVTHRRKKRDDISNKFTKTIRIMKENYNNLLILVIIMFRDTWSQIAFCNIEFIMRIKSLLNEMDYLLSLLSL